MLEHRRTDAARRVDDMAITTSAAPAQDDLHDHRAGRKPLPQGRVTYEEFLEWAEDGVHAEWVDGEVIVPLSVSTAHQLIVIFLTSLFNIFAEARDAGLVLSGPVQLRLRTRPSGREPDVMFLLKAHLDRVGNLWVEGPADLVVEVVSPDSIKRDHVDKLAEYAAAGVPEYWILDPETKDAWFYALGDDGHYHEIPLESDGVIRSRILPEFWLRVEWLWQSPPPTLLAARALGLL
jgi:Uma2 family endonuclease